MPTVDQDFTALPLDACTDAGLARAQSLGASHADLRVESNRAHLLRLRDGRLEGSHDGMDAGLAVRVVVDGSWGFAATSETTPEAAADAAERAVALARVSRGLNSSPVELAPEPVHPDGVWASAYAVDPFSVPDADKIALLAEWSATLLAADGVDHVDASVYAVKERRWYADLAGTRTLQQRVRIEPEVLIEDAAVAAEQARAKLSAKSVVPGRYDLVLDPSHLWLTIHESVGHATELDRALGYEANYAGTSFATPDRLGSLRYGSPLMNVTGDRVVQHGLATTAWDHEGVAGQSFDLVREGVLVGYQLDRSMAAQRGLPRSNGCAYADSPLHVPLQRMPNVSLQPAPSGPSTEELIAGVEHGLYVVGDKSWSIDMQRYNFQFTAQRFYLIRSGRLVGQVKDAAYQATTTDFWGSLEAVGGPQTYVLHGAFNCGKAQPGQVAAVSHGSPTGVFTGVRVLNTLEEAGR